MPGIFHSGQRLSFEGHTCTVRYVGPITGTKGDWLGVEWDDGSRGKHAGQHQGVKYFECLSILPTPASFVRPGRPHDKPRNFVNALKNKYASEDVKHVSSDQVRTSDEDLIRISGKVVEEVGFEKIRRQLANLQELRVVVLDGQCIGSSYEDDDHSDLAAGVGTVCPRITELDLSRNLLKDWREVAEIISQLSDLKALRLDGNRLSDHELDFENVQLGGASLGVQSLSIDSCLLRWQHIMSVATSFDSLRVLSTRFNNLGSFPLAASSLPEALTSIDLEGNDFHSLSELQSITSLLNLRRLSLKNNAIGTVNSISDSNNASHLSFSLSLSDVDLAYNKVSHWSFVNDLVEIFPGLDSLRLSSNPLYENLRSADGAQLNADDGFMLTLARLASLSRLNYSQITPKERLNAETYYLSQIAKELSISPEQDSPKVIAQHPRYVEFCQKYGEPVILRRTASTVNPDTLSAQLIRCHFHLDSAMVAQRATPNNDMLDEVELEIPRSFSIYNVLGLVGKRFGFPPMMLELVWEMEEETGVRKDELDDDSEDSELDVHGIETRIVIQEQVLVPRTRRLGTWLEGATAKLRLQWSVEDVERRKNADEFVDGG